MGSATRITRRRRKMKDKNQGKDRKREARNHGTTQTKAELFGDEA